MLEDKHEIKEGGVWRIDRRNSQTGPGFSAYRRGAEVGTPDYSETGARAGKRKS